MVDEAAAAELGESGMKISKMKADVIITVGGDGTILRTLRETDKPILGVNAGVLGFLTEVQPSDVHTAITRLLGGKYSIDERLKLKTVVDGKRIEDATNETVIHTAQIAKLRHFAISIDDTPATEMRADGIIVATPTGSTCYAMSVGSSIIDPRVDALVFAPIAPFRLSARPLVVPAKSHISVTIKDPRTCTLVVDGQKERALSGNEEIVFTGSEKKARFVTFNKDDFYINLEQKLMTWSPYGTRRE